jgi:signal transduction histidine kinase
MSVRRTTGRVAGNARRSALLLVGLATVWGRSRLPLPRPRRELHRLNDDLRQAREEQRLRVAQLAEQREALLKREREQVVALEEVQRARDDFIALAGHELRTPLTVIQGYAEYLLDDSAITDEQRHQLAIVVRRAGLMSDLIDDLFALAKLDSQVEPVQFDPVRVDELVRRSVATQEAVAGPSGIVMDVSAEPVNVLGEHLRLSRMVDNVLDNAVRYSPSGGRVTVSVARDGGDVVIRVADHGIGIPASELPHVFERLFRGSNAVNDRNPGTGLGLSSARAIAEGHGGTVTAEPGSPSGTVLTIRLPAHANEAD